jgi:hypothetical protein
VALEIQGKETALINRRRIEKYLGFVHAKVPQHIFRNENLLAPDAVESFDKTGATEEVA